MRYFLNKRHAWELKACLLRTYSNIGDLRIIHIYKMILDM